MDPPTLTSYSSLPSSVVPVDGDVKPIVEEYLAKYPVLNLDNPTTTANLSLVIKKLQDGGDLDGEDWIVRAKRLIAAQVPELAAFDAHKAYMLAGGVYEGPLMNAIAGEEPSEEKSKAVLVLSRALFLAGCYTESNLAISLKVRVLDSDTPDDGTTKVDALNQAGSDALQLVHSRYEGCKAVEGDLSENMLIPLLRDGKVRVVKYSFIPEPLFGFQVSAIGPLNERLGQLVNPYFSNGFTSCTILEKEASADNEGSTGQTSSGLRYGIHVTQDIPKGLPFLVETTKFSAKVHEVHEIPITSCENCLQDIPENSLPAGTYWRNKSFCNDDCARKFSRQIHVPEQLFRKVLADTAAFAKENPGKHPLEAPFIACLAAKYGSTMNLSYDRHIAAAVDELRKHGVSVSPGAKWDSSVVMNILARVQYNARAFAIGNDGAFVALPSFFPMINDGVEANIDVKWTQMDNVATVTVSAKCDLKAGDELFVGPV